MYVKRKYKDMKDKKIEKLYDKCWSLIRMNWYLNKILHDKLRYDKIDKIYDGQVIRYDMIIMIT